MVNKYMANILKNLNVIKIEHVQMVNLVYHILMTQKNVQFIDQYFMQHYQLQQILIKLMENMNPNIRMQKIEKMNKN